jgi:hypothetical protein
VGKTVDSTDITCYIVVKNRPYAQVLEEQRSSGTVTSYVYGDTLLSQATSGMAHYYVYDGMHSVRALRGRFKSFALSRMMLKKTNL